MRPIRRIFLCAHCFSDSKSYPKRKTVYTAFSSFWWNRSFCRLVFPFNILSGSILSKAPLMFLFFNLSFCCLCLLLNNFIKKQHHLKLPQVFDGILPFCWLFFPEVFLCARIFKGFSSDRGIWFQEKSCKFLAFWAQTGTLRMRPIQKCVHLKCYCTQGVCTF